MEFEVIFKEKINSNSSSRMCVDIVYMWFDCIINYNTDTLCRGLRVSSKIYEVFCIKEMK